MGFGELQADEKAESGAPQLRETKAPGLGALLGLTLCISL